MDSRQTDDETDNSHADSQADRQKDRAMHIVYRDIEPFRGRIACMPFPPNALLHFPPSLLPLFLVFSLPSSSLFSHLLLFFPLSASLLYILSPIFFAANIFNLFSDYMQLCAKTYDKSPFESSAHVPLSISLPSPIHAPPPVLHLPFHVSLPPNFPWQR